MTLLSDRRSTAGTGAAPPAPTATRSRPPGWRNPRLLLGLVLVAASVVLGARLLASADDSVPVWAVSRDLPAGATVSVDDLERRQVRFPDSATADAYLSADDALPTGSTLGREVSAGDLLPRSALSRDDGPALVEVPIGVASDDLPATVRQGSHVDVWVTPKVSAVQGQRPAATKVLDGVVVVAVPESREASLATALGSVSDGHVVVARHG